MYRKFLMLASIAALIHDVLPADGDEMLHLGVVVEKPPSGRFVEVANGIMVSYEVTIPGTRDSFWMEPIPPGTFQMGSPESEAKRDQLEGPQRTVNVDPFWMGRHEVTQGVYRHYMSLYSAFRAYRFKKWTAVTDDNQVDASTTPTVLYEPAFTFEFGKHQRMPIATVTHYTAKQYIGRGYHSSRRTITGYSRKRVGGDDNPRLTASDANWVEGHALIEQIHVSFSSDTRPKYCSSQKTPPENRKQGSFGNIGEATIVFP